MKDFHTYANLVRFAYRDTSANEAVSMADSIENNFDMRLEFEEILFAKQQLPKVQFNPSSTTLNNILQYSAKTAMETYR